MTELNTGGEKIAFLLDLKALNVLSCEHLEYRTENEALEYAAWESAKKNNNNNK